MARLLTAAVGLAVLGAPGCASSGATEDVETPARPLPTGVLAGAEVTVYPLTMLLAEATLGWDDAIGSRRTALDRVDSLIATQLAERSPEIAWVFPDALRRMARQAPGMLPNPDQIATAQLRADLDKVPDPLRSHLRALTGVAGDRHALVPASLFFFREENGDGRAELTLVLADVRTGEVRWRTQARGVGPDPWTAVRAALATLTPGLP